MELVILLNNLIITIIKYPGILVESTTCFWRREILTHLVLTEHILNLFNSRIIDFDFSFSFKVIFRTDTLEEIDQPPQE